MLPVAYVLCAVAGAILVATTLRGRPTRGEYLVGMHLAIGPFAVAFVVGAALAQSAAPLPSTAANVLLALTWPGNVLALTGLPIAAHQGGRTLLPKLLLPLVVAAPFGLGHGANLHPTVPWLAAGLLVLTGLGGSTVLLELPPLRRLRQRLARAGTTRQPSEWERNQAEWQRREYEKLPRDPSVSALLGHARSLDPTVQQQCLTRLAAHPGLHEGLVAALRGEQPGTALWYITHHLPTSRAAFAPPLNELLQRLRLTWPSRLRDDPHPHPYLGDLIPSFDCAIAVLVAGGDTRAELAAWHTELAALPKLQAVARELHRWLRKTAST